MIPNKNQWASLLRYALLLAGAYLVKHNLANHDQVTKWVEEIIGVITVIGPIAWSLWQKTHAKQAEKAIEIVNTVEGIVGDAKSGDVQLLPGASPKPALASAGDPPK